MPDRRRARRALRLKPVKKAALDLGIPVTDQISDALSVELIAGLLLPAK